MNRKSARLMEIQLEEAESVMRRVLNYSDELNQHMVVSSEFNAEVLKYVCAVSRSVHQYFVEYYFEDER